MPPSEKPKLSVEERRARHADRLTTIRMRMAIGRELDDRGIDAPAAIGTALGMSEAEATKLLTWAASLGQTRIDWIPTGIQPRSLATAAALAEMAGDKMPFALDRRIAPSFLTRFTICAVGGAALAGREASLESGALAGITGAVMGTLLGRAARGGTTRSGADWARALTEDAVAAGLAMALVRSAERRNQA